MGPAYKSSEPDSPSNLYFKAKSMISLTFLKASFSSSGGPKMKQRIASKKVLWRVFVPGELDADEISKATPITIPAHAVEGREGHTSTREHM